MKAPFPHVYVVEVSRKGHGSSTIDASPRPPIDAGPPPEFGGERTKWSPEHLLLSAVGSCFLATFEVFATREKLEILDWHDTVRGTLDRTPEGLALTAVSIEVELAVMPDDIDRANDVFTRAKHHCIVSNALRTPPTIDLRIAAA